MADTGSLLADETKDVAFYVVEDAQDRSDMTAPMTLPDLLEGWKPDGSE